jgi:hypothetical protein
LKRRIFSILFVMTLVLTLCLVPATPAAANTIASSTIVFQANTNFQLTYNGSDGTYSGIIPCVSDGSYDVYAREGATAYFSEDPNVTIANHDAWPTWDPDTPDWYQYSLNLYEDDGVQKWAIRNHPGADGTYPWYDIANWGDGGKPACGVPMSGTMDWNTMYAMETDTGAYLDGSGTPKHSGWAASHNGGAGYWDMDWSWGSEAVPLQFPGFDVTVTGSSSEDYTVTMTPASAGTMHLTVDVPDIVAISVNPTSIDFGSLVPGQTSSEHDIVVTNVGTHQVDVGADVPSGDSAMIRNNLELKNYTQSGTYTKRNWPTIIDDLDMNLSETLKTQLPVPSTHTPGGEETAQLVFTATGT